MIVKGRIETHHKKNKLRITVIYPVIRNYNMEGVSYLGT